MNYNVSRFSRNFNHMEGFLDVKTGNLKAKLECHPARCLLPVDNLWRCDLHVATDTATEKLLSYILPY